MFRDLRETHLIQIMLKIDAADAEIYTKSLNFTLSAVQLRKKKNISSDPSCLLNACLSNSIPSLYNADKLLTKAPPEPLYNSFYRLSSAPSVKLVPQEGFTWIRLFQCSSPR